MTAEVLAATEHLVLRRMTNDDAAALAAYRGDPVQARYQSWETLGVIGRVGYVDRGCAGAGEALRGHRQGRLRRRQPICCPTPLPGLAGHQRPHSGGSV